MDCSLRRQASSQFESLPSFPRADAELLQTAVQQLRAAESIVITGRVVSVEGSRAILAFAKQLNAYLDIDGSEHAFPAIAAFQRVGAMTATLSEVRNRADTIAVIADDRLLDRFPQLPQRLISPSLPRKKFILFGSWSKASVSIFEAQGADVVSINCDIESTPQSLHQWSKLDATHQTAIDNKASQWLSEASYLSIVWASGLLEVPHLDLWIERLNQWIVANNELKRCVGLPLNARYVTFQQVCTWTTGFPGRVDFKNSRIRYRPEGSLVLSTARSFDLELRIDEVPNFGSNAVPRLGKHRIHIGPQQLDPNADALHIPCGIAGYDYDAEFFRTDATICLQVEAEREKFSGERPDSAAGILSRLKEALTC
jgi:formylmethanofuran dehydrogenase subunit B